MPRLEEWPSSTEFGLQAHLQYLRPATVIDQRSPENRVVARLIAAKSIVAGSTFLQKRRMTRLAWSIETKSNERMVPRWKRVLFSLISFGLGVPLGCFFLTIRRGFGDPPSPEGIFQVFCYVSILMFVYGWPALVLALPAVLFFTDLRAWRFWALLVLGAAIGPIYFCLFQALTSRGHLAFGYGDLLISLPVSSLSTFIYLMFLRYFQGARHQRTNH